LSPFSRPTLFVATVETPALVFPMQ